MSDRELQNTQIGTRLWLKNVGWVAFIKFLPHLRPVPALCLFWSDREDACVIVAVEPNLLSREQLGTRLQDVANDIGEVAQVLSGKVRVVEAIKLK